MTNRNLGADPHRRTAWRVAAVALAAAITTTGAVVPAAAAPDRSAVRQLRAEVQATLDAIVASGVPAVEAYVRQGSQAVSAAAGVRDRVTRQPASAGDRIRAGSVTKTFVAAAVLQLVAEGRVHLDAPVRRYLQIPFPQADRTTVRMLLQHTSGLFDHVADPRIWQRYAERGDDYVWPPEEMIAIAAEHPLYFPPGTGYHYSNTNYLLLGRLIEVVTERSLQHELTTRIIAPLELSATYFPQRSTPLREPRPSGYTRTSDGLHDVTGWSTSWAWAAGSLVSTPRDLARFERALLAGRVVPREQLHQMLRTVPVLGSGQRYGLGMLVIPTRCGAAYGHNGSVPGYWTNAFTSRDGTRQVVLTVTLDLGSATPSQGRAVAAAFSSGFCPGAGTVAASLPGLEGTK